MVGCYHPIHVPPYLTATQDPRSATVQVEIEGWLHNDALYTDPPYTGGEKTDDNHYDDDNDAMTEGRYWDEQWKQGIRAARRGDQSSDDSGSSWQASVTRYNSRGSLSMAGEQVKGLMESQVPKPNGGNCSFICVQTNSKVQEFMIYGKIINDIGIGEAMVRIVQNVPYLLGMYFTPFVTPTKLIVMDEGQSQLDSNQRKELQQTDPARAELAYHSPTGLQGPQQSTNPVIMELLDNGNPIGLAMEANETPLLETEDEGPPPGFPGPPKYNQARRSPHLGEKYSGNYTTPEERARRVTRLDSVPVPHKGPRKKKNSICQAQLEYFKTYTALTKEQADLVLMTAGVEPKESDTGMGLPDTALVA